MADEEAEGGSLPEGTLVGGRFRVERMIGRGGMGEVYAARHTTTGKEVALKVIHAGAGSAGKEHVRRFLREARAATAIDHPNVIEVFDVFEDEDGRPVMVMELLHGEPFSTFRKRAGALTLHQTAKILVPALRALQVAHGKGIVHRDLKPDNVFLALSPAGRVTKVLDFGIAKVLDPTKISSETQGQHTSTGSILGTPHYMSFEQAMSDKQVDHRSDIWAMGVMIFEALTGRRPLTYETLGQMYATLLQGNVPSIRQFVPDLPSDMAAVLDRCLVKQQADRLADLGPLIDVLAKYAEPGVPGGETAGRVIDAPLVSEAAAALGSSSRGARRGRVALIALALVGGVVALLGGVAAFRLDKPQPFVAGDSGALSSPATLAHAAEDSGPEALVSPAAASDASTTGPLDARASAVVSVAPPSPGARSGDGGSRPAARRADGGVSGPKPGTAPGIVKDVPY